MLLPSGRTYELRFRSDIQPHRCEVPSCPRRAEIVPKSQRSQAWRLPTRSPDDPMMGQAEWELWSREGFRSYCTAHKCDVTGCDHGLKFDEDGRVFNLCQYHCVAYVKEIDRSEDKRRLSMTKIVSKIFSTGTPKPAVKVQEVFQKPAAGLERLAAPLDMCDSESCERLQIVNARGEGGQCEVHTGFPVLGDSGGAEAGTETVPPIAILYEVNITGRSRGGDAKSPLAAGAFVLAGGVVSAVISGLGG